MTEKPFSVQDFFALANDAADRDMERRIKLAQAGVPKREDSAPPMDDRN